MYKEYFAGQNVDVTLLTLYAFFAFFAGLVIYLQRESKREGYPLEHDVTGKQENPEGAVGFPTPKTFVLASGEVIRAPDPKRDRADLALARTAAWSGAPFEPTGANKLAAGVGPGSYAMRADVADMTGHGQPRIAPLSLSPDYHLDDKDPDLIGWPLLGVDGKVAGTVVDLWIDRMEFMIRYITVETPTGRVLIPMPMCEVKKKKKLIQTDSVRADQVAGAPVPAAADRITRLEEEKISGYFGAGYLYAFADRSEPAI